MYDWSLLTFIAVVLFGSLTLLHIHFIEKGDSTLVATLQDLDAAIAAETQENATLLSAVTQLDTDVTALIQKIEGGQDFSAEIAAVQANLATITGVVQAAQTEDTAVQGQLGQAPPPKA
jgi:hypothetical protein